MESKFKQFVRTNIAEMRPYVEGEPLKHVSISVEDDANGSPKVGDMIARNPKNHKDQWLVAAEYFKDNFEVKDIQDIDHEPTPVKPVGVVYPSSETTVFVEDDEDYGGAHSYHFVNSLGHSDGKPVYVEGEPTVSIHFVKKEESGMVAGLQSEQLLIALIDRHNKLNAKFPSIDGALAITKMQEALHWLQARVKERLDRGVMGELKV